MARRRIGLSATFGVLLLTGVVVASYAAWADEGHDHGEDAGEEDPMHEMMEMHKGHDHAHDFEAMDNVTPEQMQRIMGLMLDIGLALPPMDSGRGRELFVQKGCVVCHSVNGVGGAVGPSLNAEDMPKPMNAFEFAARMWRGAPAMVEMQEQVLGEAIDLNGQELADIIAFAHDGEEQARLRNEQIPEKYRELVLR